MSNFIINGPNRLMGEIKVKGAKNSAMKLIAASVLIKDKVTLRNVPDILDIETIISILKKNGALISREKDVLTIDTTNLTENDPDPTLVRKMRGSIVLIGPYLARFGQVSVPQPGGCAIGARPIDTHLEAFKKIGATVTFKDAIYTLELKNNQAGVVDLAEASVTATENLIMSQVIGDKVTVINNAATEPQIADLASFLNKAGAKITGAGTKTIKIQGVAHLSGTTYAVMPDPFEAATFACMAIVTKSSLKITACRPDDLHPFLDVLEKIGVDFETGEDFVQINSSNNLKSTEVVSDIHPGFSTDMLSPMGLVLTQAEGISLVREKLFENRLGYLKELEKMGAKVEILNHHEAKIYGPTPLTGAKIESLDLRAGATLLLAGLMATGQTVITDAEIIDRGYERIEERLAALGAKIERVE